MEAPTARVEASSESDRVLTVPNAISAVRLALVPVFLWLAFQEEDRVAAAWLLALLGATDWIDGWIARRWSQVSTVGKVLDPTVDRVLLVAATGAVIGLDAVPLWFGIAVLARELLVGLAGIVLGLLGAARIDVRFIGKTAAMGLMFSLPLFLAASASGLSEATVYWLRLVAWVTGGVGLVCDWLSLPGYAQRALRALKDGRFHQSTDTPPR